MTVDRLQALVADDFAAVNALIIEKSQADAGLASSLSHYIIESGGKRLRPLLVLLASRAAGYRGAQHIALAAMMEFVHTATLLHDDVVDGSSLRRGRKTANTIWGSKASVLVGDYLLTQSLNLMMTTKNWSIVELMADTMHQLSLGEVKQLSNRHNCALSLDDYFEIIRSKTALLFAASAAIGAHLAEAEKTVQEGLYYYGLHLGNAFQLIDDMLDYSSTAETLGKNAGDDLAEGVITMPLLHALQEGNPQQKQTIQEALKKGSHENLSEILEAITATKALEATKTLAFIEVDKALTQLNVLPNSPYKEALIALAELAVRREH